MRASKAFSLIELMVVIAILGIIAAVAIPSYKNYVTKANLVKGVNYLMACNKKIETYYAEYDEYPNKACNVESSATDMNPPEKVFSYIKYTKSDVNDSALLSGGLSSDVSLNDSSAITISSTYNADKDSFEVHCGRMSTSDLSDELLSLMPKECRDSNFN